MSRFITYPSIEARSPDHTVILVDATVEDIEQIGLFCAVSQKEYDIYLYRQDLDDLQWLHNATEVADIILLNDTSAVQVNNCNTLIKFGSTQTLINPLDYFQKIDQPQ